MHPIAEPLSVVLEEAYALWRELETGSAGAGGPRAMRATRLLRAAEVCHQALGGPAVQRRSPDANRGRDRADEPVVLAPTPWRALSARELEVLRLLATGRTDREIATALCVSHRTITTHVASIFGKLGVGNRTAAATFALSTGLLGDRPVSQIS